MESVEEMTRLDYYQVLDMRIIEFLTLLVYIKERNRRREEALKTYARQDQIQKNLPL